MALNLRYQTATQFAARLRNQFQNSTKERAGRIAHWMIERVNAGDVTEAQLRTAFGLTAQQWTTLKNTKLIPLHDAWVALQNAQGE